MVADQAAKYGSDSSSKTPVERSPHAKEVSAPLPPRAARRRPTAPAPLPDGVLPPPPVTPQSYEAKEFEALAAKYEKLNWRIISKPGGATVKPDDFYLLYG